MSLKPAPRYLVLIRHLLDFSDSVDIYDVVNNKRFCRKKESCKSEIYSFLNDLTSIFVARRGIEPLFPE